MPTNSLTHIVDTIVANFTQINDIRDATLNRSRTLIRTCAHCIRAIHRHDWDEADRLLAEARAGADAIVAPLADYPTIYHTGYTQDALKEVVEAHLVYAVVRGGPVPTPEELGVAGPAYLKGMTEAATEMRRFVLDLMRRGRVEEAEPYLAFMDDVYSLLITVDFSDAITEGLRRQTDTLRGVLERTRGDLTMGIRQEQMRAALAQFEERLGVRSAEYEIENRERDLESEEE